MNSDEMKEKAAQKAMDYVLDGMKLGLGTGSTAAKFVDLVGAAVADGLSVICVPTSVATRDQAAALNIPLTTLDETPHLDLTVDGADELDEQLRLVKGGGGALLREKIVATSSDKMVVIADDSKLVETLGAFPLPIEVVQFGLKSSLMMMNAMASRVGCSGDIKHRMLEDGTPFITDNGNFILDCHFGRIEKPEALSGAFAQVPGVVENGLFLAIADVAIIAGEEGITTLELGA
ncbi:MAG: ribose-5-phosphate isomerase RpiA [Hyphomicrobiaceae bacterium]|nr:ribose-5-phosphate isomerase RpiA [Hyphomicrobiaceae bacterium]